jgi:hypothetical protein
MPKSKKAESTYSRWMRKPAFKKAFEEGYRELLLSELVLAMMAEEKKSMRELAGELGVSKTVITRAYGYHVVLEKGDQRISL